MDENMMENMNAENGLSRQSEVLEVQVPKTKSRFWSGMLSGVLLTCIVLGGIYIGKQVYTLYSMGNQEASSTVKKGTDNINRKMSVIEDTIEKYYLEEVDGAQLLDGVYSGMVDSLGDPYSEYYSIEELEEMMMETEGIYYGIGAYVSLDTATQLCMISGVIEGTPAEEAQLRTGDIIYKVDGTSTQGMDTTEVVSLIKGEENTMVHLTLVREGVSDYVEVDVERRKIETPTVEYEMLEGDIGYIQITEFDEITTDQFTEALAVCKGSDMKGLILDLRSNPGGSLGTVCEIAGKLLPKGLIVYTEDKYGEKQEYTCDGSNPIQVPVVVLVNGYSASASEILAGAIKDHEVGIIMGTTTYGKGIVQRIIGLSDGSALKLTVSKYYTPAGNDIHGVGIEPDVVVEYDADAFYDEGIDNQLEAAKEYMAEEIAKQ